MVDKANHSRKTDTGEQPAQFSPSEKLLPIVADPEHRYDPFPLTDIQQAYWIGRSGQLELGRVSTHRYMEVDCTDLDVGRLSQAWQRLIERHDMLRAVVHPDGRQQVLKDVPPYRIEVLDLRGESPAVISRQLEAIRSRMSHQVLPSDRWPLFEIRATRLEEGLIRLHLSFDALILDARSRHLLFLEWAELYNRPEANLPELNLTFRDFVMAETALKQTDIYRQARDHWLTRVPGLPPRPDLPLAVQPRSILQPRFRRYHETLDPQTWHSLKNSAARRGLRPALLLLTAYAQVLKAWSGTSSFSINLTLFNRMARDPRLRLVVGDFTTSALIAVDTANHETFEDRARHIQERVLTDLHYSAFSGVQVIREILRQGGPPESEAVMPVVFTSLLSMDSRFQDSEPIAWLGEMVHEITQTPQVWLDYQVSEKAGVLRLNWDVVEELFPRGMISDMFEASCRFLQRLAHDDRTWRESWPALAQALLPAGQLRQMATVNATRAPVSDKLLQTLFAEQVPKRPTKPAVIAPVRMLTYEELQRLARRIGSRLRRLGARPGTLVAVVMEKGWEQVAAVLGVLFSGAAYLPIDPRLPRERLHYLLENGQVELSLTVPALDQALDWPKGIQRLLVEEEQVNSTEIHPLEEVGRPDDLAYVIYTSGSTGSPKGVMIAHRGAVNTIADINRRFGVGPGDRVLALSSLSFDLSVYDIFGPLAAGGTIVMPEGEAVRDPASLAALLWREKITVWNSVPVLLALLVDYLEGRGDLIADSLRLVLLSGDWIPLGLPDRIKRLARSAEVISLGGATEASIWSIIYPIESVDPAWPSIPYGRPLANQTFHVLDEALASRPVWVPGHLYIGGTGLASGYWRFEEKTRDSFPIHPLTGERLFRTGDVGRSLPDGTIQLLGREDVQFKIQGFRVEPGEIETALMEHPALSGAIVTAFGDDGEEKRLAAYIVPKSGSAPGTGELRHYLEHKVPRYMVPSIFIALEQLPLTADGKIDRRALPPPEKLTVEGPWPAAGQTGDLTARMKQCIMKVLKIDHLDPRANLLNAGATSVDIIRIANLVENELGFRPRLDEFYRQPTAAGLADLFERHCGPGRDEWQKRPAPWGWLSGSAAGSLELILDPEEREAFKAGQPGLRPRDPDQLFLSCAAFTADSPLKVTWAERRSHRHFDQAPLTLARLGRLVGCLQQTGGGTTMKYAYGSAGGLYPVQTYLVLKPGRLESAPPGVYYYHPVDNGLVQLSSAELEGGIYDPLINRPIFEQAAFAIFLIARMEAIVPLYGELSRHYVTIEAGLMAQILEMAAPACGIGLCQVGDLDFGMIRHLFDLDNSHILVHSLLGGPLRSRPEDGPPRFADAPGHTAGSQKGWEEGEL